MILCDFDPLFVDEKREFYALKCRDVQNMATKCFVQNSHRFSEIYFVALSRSKFQHSNPINSQINFWTISIFWSIMKLQKKNFGQKYFIASYGAQQYHSWYNQKIYSFPLLSCGIIAFIIFKTITPFFTARTHFCTTNIVILRQVTYIHYVAHEIRVIRKIFPFNFFIKQGRNLKRKGWIVIGITCRRFTPFWRKTKEFSANAGFLGYNVSIGFLTEKLLFSEILGTKVWPCYKKRRLYIRSK